MKSSNLFLPYGGRTPLRRLVSGPPMKKCLLCGLRYAVVCLCAADPHRTTHHAKLHIFVDRSSVELFANDGGTVISIAFSHRREARDSRFMSSAAVKSGW